MTYSADDRVVNLRTGERATVTDLHNADCHVWVKYDNGDGELVDPNDLRALDPIERLAELGREGERNARNRRPS